ncbi:hypothetical protein [Halomonas alkalisoli]|uniref:hypothetical protein n=1 Tax=Halomonas alkalisoli TaxID=2907158 RepID=UPI001F37CDA9|nr:hypothetical protein [Halomonas alkalisoli]
MILFSDDATPLSEHLQIATGGRRPPGGVGNVAAIAVAAASVEAPGGASRDAERRSNSCSFMPWQAITTL